MIWLEKHLNHNNTALQNVPEDLNSNENFVFSETHNTRIHAMGLSVGGPEFQSDEHGFMYLWRDASHFTLMMPCGKGCSRQLYLSLPGSGLVVPAGVNYCFRWWFNRLSAPRQIFADIAYTLEDVAP